MVPDTPLPFDPTEPYELSPWWTNGRELLRRLAVELVLSGPPASVPGPGVRLMRAVGATVHQLPTADRAAREAERLGFTGAVIPANNTPSGESGIHVLPIRRLSDAVDWMFGSTGGADLSGGGPARGAEARRG